MSDNDFQTTPDPATLCLENELLSFEVRFLRARLGWSGGGVGTTTASLSRIAHLEDAERDLVLLLRRMTGSPLGPVFRRSGSFRTLEHRYLQAPVGGPSTSPQRVAYLEGAEKDLELLLRRMGSGPLGKVMRRRSSFRTLEQRYL